VSPAYDFEPFNRELGYSFIRESGVYHSFLSVSPAYDFIRESGVQFFMVDFFRTYTAWLVKLYP